MPIIKDEVKALILSKLQDEYEVKCNVFVKGRLRDTIIPICIMANDGSPFMAIRIRLRDKESQKYSNKPTKRLQRWEEITGNQVVTIWNREQAEDILATVTKLINA